MVIWEHLDRRLGSLKVIGSYPSDNNHIIKKREKWFLQGMRSWNETHNLNASFYYHSIRSTEFLNASWRGGWFDILPCLLMQSNLAGSPALLSPSNNRGSEYQTSERKHPAYIILDEMSAFLEHSGLQLLLCWTLIQQGNSQALLIGSAVYNISFNCSADRSWFYSTHLQTTMIQRGNYYNNPI